MDYLYFMAFVIGGAVLILGAITVTSKRRSGPTIPLLRVGIAAGEAEANLWGQALRSAGIWYRVQAEAEKGSRPIGYTHELWVREKDNDRAREVPGCD